MEFRILGPLEAREGDDVVRLGGARQRALLAILLLHANEVISVDRLVDELWAEAYHVDDLMLRRAAYVVTAYFIGVDDNTIQRDVVAVDMTTVLRGMFRLGRLAELKSSLGESGVSADGSA